MNWLFVNGIMCGVFKINMREEGLFVNVSGFG